MNVPPMPRWKPGTVIPARWYGGNDEPEEKS